MKQYNKELENLHLQSAGALQTEPKRLRPSEVHEGYMLECAIPDISDTDKMA